MASATASLVKCAKSAAVAISQEATELANTETDSATIADQRDAKVAFLRDIQGHLVHAATHAGKTTSRLVTSAKVAVCTMEQPATQRQLLGCVKQVSGTFYCCMWCSPIAREQAVCKWSFMLICESMLLCNLLFIRIDRRRKISWNYI